MCYVEKTSWGWASLSPPITWLKFLIQLISFNSFIFLLTDLLLIPEISTKISKNKWIHQWLSQLRLSLANISLAGNWLLFIFFGLWFCPELVLKPVWIASYWGDKLLHVRLDLKTIDLLCILNHKWSNNLTNMWHVQL